MQINVDPEHYALLRALYQASVQRQQELTLMGGAKAREGQVWITTLVMPKQEGSASFTELVGKPTWMDDLTGLAPVWIHTHPGMGAFWSHQDQETLDAFAPPPMTTEAMIWGVSIVLGRDKWLGRVSVWQPFEMVIEPVAVCMEPGPGSLPLAMEWIKAQVQKQVSWYVWKAPKGGYGKWQNWGKDMWGRYE